MASVAKVVTNLTGATGLPGYSVQYYLITGTTPTSAEANDIVGRVQALWTAIKAYLPSGMSASTTPVVEAYDVATGSVSGTQLATAVSPAIGTGASNLPTATALGLRLTTNSILNRKFLVGRVFVSPLAQVATTAGGLPAAAALTALQTGGNGLLTGATTASLSVWHRPSASHTGGTIGAVTGVSAVPKFWVLRSRRD